MLKSREPVLFRVDANAKMGAGHLMRCIALAYAFRALGHESIFIVNQDTQDLIHSLPVFEFACIVLDIELSNKKMLQRLCLIAEEHQANTLILDGYQFTSAYRESIKSIGFQLVLLDDENNSGALFADIVINPTNSALTLNYPMTAPHALHLLGNDFILLRPEFQQQKTQLPENPNRLFISFGASDVAGLTQAIVDSLLRQSFCFDKVDVVTGSAFKGEETLSAKVAESKVITYHHNVLNMAELMIQARLAICAAGGTLFELRSLGVPAILVVVADNQWLAAKEQEILGWCKVFDARHGIDVELLMAEAVNLWQDSQQLKLMHNQALSTDIAGGALRAAIAIKEFRQTNSLCSSSLCSSINAYGVRLREVQYCDLERIRHWRNDPDIKCMMLSQDTITAEQQIAWFRKITDDLKQQHFVIEYKSQAIGVINIKSLDNKSLNESLLIEPGLYIAELRYRNNALAFCPSMAILDYCFEGLACQKIMARVLRNNHSAIKYNLAMGYSLPEDDINDLKQTENVQYLTMTLSASDYYKNRATIKASLRLK